MAAPMHAIAFVYFALPLLCALAQNPAPCFDGSLAPFLPSSCSFGGGCLSISCEETISSVDFSVGASINLCVPTPNVDFSASATVLDETVSFEQVIVADFTYTLFDIPPDGPSISAHGVFHQANGSFTFSLEIFGDNIFGPIDLPIPTMDECIALGYKDIAFTTCTISDRGLFYTHAATIIYCFAMVAGLVACFLGYRLFKIMLFLSGFLTVGVAAFVLASHELHASSQDTLDLESLGIAVGCGIVGGCVVICLWYVGLFLIGATFGALIFFFFVIIVHESAWFLGHLYILYTFTALFAVAGGILCIKFEKLLIMLSTACAGAFGVMAAVDYFAEQGRAMNLIKSAFDSGVTAPGVQIRLLSPLAAKCWYTDMTIALWPILAALGFFVQYRFTGRRWDHRRGRYEVTVVQMEMHHPLNDSAPLENSFDDFNKDYPMGSS